AFIPAYMDMSQANIWLARPERTIALADQALRLSPADPYGYVFHALKGYAHCMLEAYDAAVECLGRAVAENPGFPTPYAFLAGALALSGRLNDARTAMARYLSFPATQARTIAAWRSNALSRLPAYLRYRERIMEGLRQAGLPEE